MGPAKDLGGWPDLGVPVTLVFFVRAVALPPLMLVWPSLLPSAAALTSSRCPTPPRSFPQPNLIHSAENSLITAVVCGRGLTPLSTMVAYLCEDPV